MKVIGFNKKNLIALALAGVLALTSFGVYQVKAAVAVDTDKSVTITANVEAESLFATNYAKFNGKNDVYVNLYKIASLNKSGDPVLEDAFKDEENKIDLTVLKGDKVTVQAVKDKIVTPALNLANDNNKTDTITVPMTGNEKYSGSVTIEKGAGIYLYVPQDKDKDNNDAVKDDRYTYSFTPYVIMAPSSEYITATGTDEEGNEYAEALGNDNWNYSVSFNLKAEAKHRYGYLGIDKLLDRYNESLGTASFVYEVTATFDGEEIYHDFTTVDLQRAGEERGFNGDALSLPAGADVTVKEVYTGASYDEKIASKFVQFKATDSSEEAGPNYTTVAVDPIILADDIIVASFENDYDNELQVGAISIVNRYRLIDGSYEYIGNNLVQEQPVQPVEPIQPSDEEAMR